MEENYLAKWLNNELSEQERLVFEQSEEYATYQKIKEATTNLYPPKFDQDLAWDRFKNENLVQADKVRALHPFKPFLWVAATITLLITGAFLFLSTLNTTISTSYAQRETVLLPDDSEVVLNADSQLKYHKASWDESRSLVLNGEAYFKVAKGKTFSVTTDEGIVKVLGTQFNVNQRKGFFEVVCYEGLVSVTYNQKEIKLPAGSGFKVVGGQIEQQTGLEVQAPSWLADRSSFNSIPLKMVLEELERQYDLIVETKNVNLEQRFTGSFHNTNLESALKSIGIPTQLKYELAEGKVLFYETENP